jgi:hypothetical protein
MENENRKSNKGVIGATGKAVALYKKTDEIWMKYALLVLPLGLIYGLYLLIMFLAHKIGL